MKMVWLLAAALASNVTLANDKPILLSPNAEFSHPDVIAENIKRECNLPSYQAKVVRDLFQQHNIVHATAEKDEVPSVGRFLQLRIDSAYSAGNAAFGHRKQVTTSARLFEDGKEIAKFQRTRNSKGGAFGGFQGSCAILERCADALASDMVKWMKNQSAMSSSAAAGSTEANETDRPASSSQ